MSNIAKLLSEQLTDTWKDAQGLPDENTIRGLLEVPPDTSMGDYAFPCFRLAKALRMAPPKIALTLSEAWSHDDVAKRFSNRESATDLPRSAAEKRSAWTIRPSILPSVSTSVIFRQP